MLHVAGRLSDRLPPKLSASRVLSTGQVRVLAVVGAVLLAGLATEPVAVLVVVNAVVTGIYASFLVHRMSLFRRTLRAPAMVTVTDEDARGLSDRQLPIYTVLIAAYQEQAVIESTVRAMERLDYPTDRLDIKLLLEVDDVATIAAARAAGPPGHIEIVLVPRGTPRTKPRALNHGLDRARGELVTVYDAEDRPEPLQLRRAVVAFQRSAADLGCLQARLSYHNPRQNALTGWFAVEYLSWFACMLPAIAERGGPVPLGGTSMHMRRTVLEHVGAWDPHNVTEDADLGMRLSRMAYRTAVLDSTTDEEANSDVINWVKQRSRWYKGYVQTWLVHMRHPVLLWRQLGTAAFLRFNLLLGGTTLVALLNPVFWFITPLWFTAKPELIHAIFPDWIYFPGLISMVLGNFLACYTGLVTIRSADRPDLLRAVLTFPVYWALMSVGAFRGILQLVIAPFRWEKTTHGLDRVLRAEVS